MPSRMPDQEEAYRSPLRHRSGRSNLSRSAPPAPERPVPRAALPDFGRAAGPPGAPAARLGSSGPRPGRASRAPSGLTGDRPAPSHNRRAGQVSTREMGGLLLSFWCGWVCEHMRRRSRAKSGFNGADGDAALAEFRRQLTYKCSWYGSTLWVASRLYKSSKLCARCRTNNGDLPRSARVFHCDACGLVIDRDLNAAKNLAALAEFGCVCLMAQLTTGQPVDWSRLPVRPAGWELDHSTRSSRGRARAGGRRADGGEMKTAQRSSAGDDSFDREAAVATGSVVGLDGASPSPRKAVA